MIGRRNLVLLAVLAALVAVDVATRPAATAALAPALFPALDPERVARIEVTDATGTFAVVREGDGWRLPNRFGFPAHAYTCEQLLAQLAALDRADRVGTEGPGYGLDATDALTVRALGAQDAPLAALRQGGATGDGTPPPGGSFVSPLDDDGVYRAAFVPRLDTDPRRWLDGRCLRFDLSQLAGLALAFEDADGAEHVVRLARAPNGAWSDADDPDRRVPVVAADRLASGLSRLYLTDVLAAAPSPAHGLDDPRFKATIELAGGDALVLQVGAEVDGGLAATVDGWERPFVVRLDPASVAELLGAGVELLPSD